MEKIGVLNKLKNSWKTPSEGRYMPLKEIVSLSVGGIGVRLIVTCVNNMVLAVGNTLIGNTIGINPSALYIIYIISILSSFPLTALRAKMIDGAKSMKGKYRPYILRMGIPTVILGIGFIWMPYENMQLITKCAVVLLFNIGFQFFYNFMCDAYDSLINVLSPNTIERSDVCSVKAVVENLSPSVFNIFMPLIARAITGSNTLYDMRVYRALYPPMLLAGLLISVLIYVNTEEKIVQPRNHAIPVKFFDAFRAVAANKYFWIISLAGWLGFLESSFSSIMGWMYNYQQACSPGQYSLIVAISGNASFWPNLIAPFFIRKYGKKKVLVYTNLLNIIFIVLMLPIVRMESAKAIWVLLICNFVNQLISALGHLLNPSLNADIRDYQQYISGKRIDGMFSAVGLIGNVITLASGSVLPVLYRNAGLNQSTAIALGLDGSNVYDVLYNPQYFVQVSSILIFASVAGAVMNVIPFFFYDLTETRQRAMIAVLKIRAMFNDYNEDILSDEKLIEAMDIIKEAESYASQEPELISKGAVREARKARNREKARELESDNKAKAARNEKIEIARFIKEELQRFDTDEGREEVRKAQLIANAGLNNYLSVSEFSKKDIKAMPKSTPAEKKQRRKALRHYGDVKRAKKTVERYYKSGLTEFDSKGFSALFASFDALELKISETIKQLKAAKEQKDTALSAGLRERVEELQREKARLNAEIKLQSNRYADYNRAAKPYLDALSCIAQNKAYHSLDLISQRYEKLKAEREAAAQLSLSGQ